MASLKLTQIRLYLHACSVVGLFGIFAVGQAMATPNRHTSLDFVPTPDFTESLIESIERGRDNIQAKKIDHHWDLPAYLGPNFISQYVLMQGYLETSSSAFDPARFKGILLGDQKPDGGWQAIHDANTTESELNPTILNYLALKAMGESTTSEVMGRAKTFILSHGGVEQSSLFTKLVLSLHGNYSWNEVPEIPIEILLSPASPITLQSFGQWVGPHIVPISYMRGMNLRKELGERFKANELWVSQERYAQMRAQLPPSGLPTGALSPRWRELIQYLLSSQKTHGSWGAYTVSTLMTIIALDHYRQQYPQYTESVRRVTENGYRFVHHLYFNSGEHSYFGTLEDGHYWDTALMGIALIDSGVRDRELERVGAYFARHQTPSGGWPFGIDFDAYPDTDDTAEIILFLKRLGGFEPQVERAKQFLISMQNQDGGWGAFDRNNTGNSVIHHLAAPFLDSADLFDESSPDVTGHILEAFGILGYNRHNSPVVARAVEYLKRQQDPDGKWFGRWGINYIYGTGAAVVGLIKSGENPSEPYIARALAWLESKQNRGDCHTGDETLSLTTPGVPPSAARECGGWGETFESYIHPERAGQGVSTPSQTAWALLALVEAGKVDGLSARLGAKYLMRTLRQDGHWIDRSTVGTGHPGVLSMDYPAYPYAFPQNALTRYARAIGIHVGP